MMIPQSQLFIVEQLARITANEVRYLEQVVNKLRLMNIDLAWVESLENSEDHSVTLDAFVARFGRLQDTLGDKLLPALLRLNLEKVGSQLDNLFRGEKFGWIESTQTLDRTSRTPKPFGSRIHGIHNRPVECLATSFTEHPYSIQNPSSDDRSCEKSGREIK